MSIITILLFFIYTLGLGYSLTSFLKSSENFLERNLMRIGIGLAMLPVLAFFLGILHIPVDWKIILLLSLITPIICLIKDYRNIKIQPRITKSSAYVLIVLFLFFITLFMYAKGAFSYPYLEDDDSWGHALGVKYVATEKTLFNPASGTNYLDPYPPAYNAILGLLHQTSPSLSWTMKFFNALIISLSIIFFYFFVKEFVSDRQKALFATIILAVIPSYLTHFIWAHALIPGFFFLAFYALERIKYDQKWIIPSTIAITAIFLTQMTQSIKFGVFFLAYWGVKSIYDKKVWKKLITPFVISFLISLLWWLTRWRSIVGNILSYTEGTGAGEASKKLTITGIWHLIKRTFPPNSGTATRTYDFDDFFIAKYQNLINNPTGLGIAISILLILGIVYVILRYKTFLEKKNNWVIIILLWLTFTFLGINSLTFNLPIGLFAFRFWMLFAIPVSILAAEGILFLFYIGRLIKIPKAVILFVVIPGLIFTAGIQKYTVNTAQWPPGAFWTSFDEVNGFVWIKENMPKNTKVFSFVNEGVINGVDMYACRWCPEEREFKEDALEKSPETIHSFLKARDYEYLVIEGQFAKKYGMNGTNEKLNELANSGLFQPEFQNNGLILFKLV